MSHGTCHIMNLHCYALSLTRLSYEAACAGITIVMDLGQRGLCTVILLGNTERPCDRFGL